MSKEEINRIETLAASFFEKSDDIVAVTFAIQTYIERRKELRRKQELEMKS